MPESTSPARFDQDARVVVAVVDPYGFTGRERHPQRTDVGRAGVVLSCRRAHAGRPPPRLQRGGLSRAQTVEATVEQWRAAIAA